MTKRILSLTIALAGALALPAFAEDAKPATAEGAHARGPGGRPGMMNPEERLKHMKEVLGLTDEQTAKILPILQKSQETTKSIREDASLQQDDKRTKMGENMKSTAEEVGAILTPEQKEKWKAEMEKRRAERGGAAGGPGKNDAAK